VFLGTHQQVSAASGEIPEGDLLDDCEAFMT
jgi:hypothetical protein